LSPQMGKLTGVSRSSPPAVPTLVSIRPSVLTVFYRVSGDLRRSKQIANHAHLSTTVGYVQGPESRPKTAVHRACQMPPRQLDRPAIEDRVQQSRLWPPQHPYRCHQTSLIDVRLQLPRPFRRVAPGTRRGVCTNFLGVHLPHASLRRPHFFGAPASGARPSAAANTYLHPAPGGDYAPQLRFWNEDISRVFRARVRPARRCATLYRPAAAAIRRLRKPGLQLPPACTPVMTPSCWFLRDSAWDDVV